MIDFNLMTILIELDPDGTISITTEMNPVLPEMIHEMELRQMIHKGLAQAYLDQYNDWNMDPQKKEMLKSLAQMIKATHFVADMRNPKSTENDHEII